MSKLSKKIMDEDTNKKQNTDEEVTEETSGRSLVDETPLQDAQEEESHIESQDETAPSADFNAVEEKKIEQEEAAHDKESEVDEPVDDTEASNEENNTVQEESSDSDGDKDASENTNGMETEATQDSDAHTDESTEQEAADASNDTEETTETSEEDSTPNTPPSTIDQPDQGKWYVVHTYSGHENKVATTLRQRIESEHLENKIYDILVPTQDKIEIRSGKKEQVKEKIFPGYILVKMDLDDISWLAVRTTQGVTSFVGIGNKPTPIPAHEVASIVKFMNQGAPATFKDVFLIDDTVKIIDGPFSDFIGKVDSVDKEKGKVRVLVSIFGRETPVELDFLQITKL